MDPKDSSPNTSVPRASNAPATSPQPSLLETNMLSTPQVKSAQAEGTNSQPSPALTPQQQSCAQRKTLKLKRQGHATTGAVSMFLPPQSGREVVPLAPESVREIAFSFNPYSAHQVTCIKKFLRSPFEQEVTLDNGTVLKLKLKPSTRDEALAAAWALEDLKPTYREHILDLAKDLMVNPNGLSREWHQNLQAQLDAISPRRLMEWPQELELPYMQALMQEAQTAWDDPRTAGLSCFEAEIPAKPTAQTVNAICQCLAERTCRLPEPLRIKCDDLFKLLKLFQAKLLAPLLIQFKQWLELSAPQFVKAILDFGQRLSPNYSFISALHPQEFEAAAGDMHKLLSTTLILPKAKKVSAKHSKKSNAADTTAQGTANQPRPSRKARSTKPKSTKAQPKAPAKASPQSTPSPAEVHFELEDLMEPYKDTTSTQAPPAPQVAPAPTCAPTVQPTSKSAELVATHEPTTPAAAPANEPTAWAATPDAKSQDFAPTTLLAAATNPAMAATSAPPKSATQAPAITAPTNTTQANAHGPSDSGASAAADGLATKLPYGWTLASETQTESGTGLTADTHHHQPAAAPSKKQRKQQRKLQRKLRQAQRKNQH